MNCRWYKEAIIYSLDVDTFKDGNGDGIGDFHGLTRGLRYLSGLGVNCSQNPSMACFAAQ